MDLSIGDRVFYTYSNGVRVTTTVVGMVERGLLHADHDVVKVVNRQCKMQSNSFATPSSDAKPSAPVRKFPFCMMLNVKGMQKDGVGTVLTMTTTITMFLSSSIQDQAWELLRIWLHKTAIETYSNTAQNIKYFMGSFCLL